MNISKEFLKQIIIEQRQSILLKKPGITRTALEQISSIISIPHVVVIKGLRRCGKSTLLRQIIQKYYNDTEFYYINFEDERLINFPAESFSVILETQMELFGEKKTIFLDEIQQNKNFETYVRRLNDEGYKFFITGSNANLLSSEISTKLTGRHVDISLYPFSFNEYLKFKEIDIANESLYLPKGKAIIKNEFEIYLMNGGMPEYLNFQVDEIIYRIYEDIILKDIAIRYGITMVKPMRELYHYLISNICNLFSYRTLTRITDIESSVTIKNYIHYLEQTFFITQVGKFDFSLKKQLANKKKIYIIDNAFFQKISFQFSGNKGWLLENLVANELSKYGELFYYNEKYACDFIVKNNQSYEVYQIAFEFSDLNREREIKGLVEALNYLNIKEGIIITNDDEQEINYKGYKINIIPCWKWLLK
ncbi:MAG: ATP-binding protein [Candidatus Atribacteria bacterium]|nr:ATP-binding protein [Candidatus Atribacteria bacterium]